MIFGAGQGQGESETGRLEAFSDGVLAVIITIMALELKPPEDGTFRACTPGSRRCCSTSSASPSSGSTGTTTTTCCAPPAG